MSSSWEALAFVFAIIPAIVSLAYFYHCGHSAKTPSLRELFRHMRMAEKAKGESYKRTAQAFMTDKSPAGLIAIAAWGLALIVCSFGPGLRLVLVCFVLAVPCSVLSYLLGKRNRE